VSEAESHARFERAFEDVEAPFAFVDLDAFDANAEDLLRRAHGKAIRAASSSLRCRALQQRLLDHDAAFRGLTTFTLPETLWLHGLGFDDLLLAHATVDRKALAELGLLQGGRRPIVTVDSSEHLDLIEAAAAPVAQPIRLCIDLDLTPRAGVGRRPERRSAIQTPADAAALAREIARRPSFELAALLGHETRAPGRKAAARELADRRAAAVEAVEAVAPGPLIVNGGGAHGPDAAAAEDAVTEITIGAGFFAPSGLEAPGAEPAAFFALPVTRGYDAAAGAGAEGLRVGDRVFLRPEQAGELGERFETLHLVEGEKRVGEVPTYRGEGKAFL
jgi:D-serine deaminase-like pyridoxal phosphate-dependent protein